ncbi:MAG: hypothetical protein IPK82_07335 [Polyangiaceae bacterium]|nr:hypothetical protein [Polyangiaceae bacterium]
MRLTPVPSSSRPNALPLGEMRFVASTHVPDVCADLAGRKFLVVGAPAGPLAPTGLRRRIDDAVESELAARGALPAATSMDADLASCIRDQVFRTRALGTTGLAIALPPLSELADANGHLNVDDSAALLSWTRATTDLPVVLLASEADRRVSAYAPMPLERLIASEGRLAPDAPPPAVDEATWIEASREPASDPFDMTPPPSAVAPAREEARLRSLPPNTRRTPQPPAVRVESQMKDAAAPAPVITVAAAPTAAPISAEQAAIENNGRRLKAGILKGAKRGPRPDADMRARIDAALAAEENEPHDAHEEHSLFAAEPARASVHNAPAADAPRASVHQMADVGAPRNEVVRSRENASQAAEPAVRAPRPEEVVAETALVAARARDTQAARAVNAAEWRSFAVELDAARGPKPVRVIEQLFMTRYIPLVGAVARGEADNTVRAVVEGWAQAFEHSYTDSFSAMRVTNKRPMMTFDAPEIATRIARLNGARGVKLLLVDGMSFDLGERVSAELRARATASGVCVDRLLLWSALPTHTSMQMSLLAKGPEALRDVEPPSDPEPEIARGRAIGTLRRERAGARELMKLDLVEARLRTAGPSYDERLDNLADEVASVLARYLESLPPRTLLFVFGDHGFRLPRAADGRSTSPATQGGASPEEVLVPAYAWLSGGVH